MKYYDIIHLPHPVSKRHQQMNLNDRAKIFLPFAALKGYEELIAKKNEIFEKRRTLAEDKRNEIEATLNHLYNLKEQPLVSITYFEPNKEGLDGHYKTITSFIKRIDEIHFNLLINDTWIEFEDILEIEIK